MAQQTINVGTAPNDGTGTPLRTAFQYTNSNFSELYTAVGPSGNNIVVPGNATITGDLTVRTNKLAVTSVGVGVGTSSPLMPLDVRGATGAGAVFLRTTDPTAPVSSAYIQTPVSTGFSSTVPVYGFWYQNSGMGNPANDTLSWIIGSGEQMRLNSTGLGVGRSPSYKLDVAGVGNFDQLRINATSATKIDLVNGTTGVTYSLFNANSVSNGFDGFGIFNGTSYDLRIVSGNVGIGVTPSAWNSSASALEFKNGIALYSFGGGTNGNFITNGFYNSGGSFIYKTSNTATRYQQFDGSHLWYTAPSGTAGNAITFTQAMTLDASGNLLVGTTTAGAKITALAGASGQAAIFQQPAQNFWCVLAHNQATSGDNSFVLFGTEASFTSRGSITYNRAAGQVSYNITSDYRLKEDVKPLTGALNRISSLKPSTYKFKETGFTCEGFIAHELAEVIPAAVTGDKDAVNEDGSIKAQGVDLSKVVPVLVAAIQELAAEVNALKNA